LRPSARTRANRANAKRSTGPRTAAGKGRVSKNAHKHGLAVPIMLQNGAEARIEEMAQAIVGSNADPVLFELARRIAESQLDLIRIKEARRLLLEDPKARLRRLNMREIKQGVKELMKWGDQMAAKAANEFEGDMFIEEACEKMERLIEERVHQVEPPSLEQGFWRLAPRLIILDRYEQRATSRRKKAMRAFDDHRAGLEAGPADASGKQEP
jgi:hypothetical protein